MLGELNPEQIERLLMTAVYGRIGCHTEGDTYVVPITYAYDGENIVCHTGEGMKTRMMRANPKVCFQVDQFEDLGNWRSVIAWGTFEELRGDEAATALAFLVDRITPYFQGQTLTPFHEGAAIRPRSELDRLAQAIMFRIRLERKTGRFERRAKIFKRSR